LMHEVKHLIAFNSPSWHLIRLLVINQNNSLKLLSK
jgi:hypothetical protein